MSASSALVKALESTSTRWAAATDGAQGAAAPALHDHYRFTVFFPAER